MPCHMSSDRIMYGSIGAGILVGLVMLALFGWITLYGWLAAGIAAGLASRGSARGFLAGLISGIILSVMAIALSLFVPVSTLSTYAGYMGNQYIQTTLITPALNLLGLQTTTLVKELALDYILIPALGGFVGGAILSNGYRVEEVEDGAREEPEPKRSQAQIVDGEKEEVSS